MIGYQHDERMYVLFLHAFRSSILPQIYDVYQNFNDSSDNHSKTELFHDINSHPGVI